MGVEELLTCKLVRPFLVCVLVGLPSLFAVFKIFHMSRGPKFCVCTHVRCGCHRDGVGHGIQVAGLPLAVAMAVGKDDARSIAMKGVVDKHKDKRNLYLVGCSPPVAMPCSSSMLHRLQAPGLDRPCRFASFTTCSGPVMISPGSTLKKTYKVLARRANCQGHTGAALAVPGLGSHPRGFCWGCPALSSTGMQGKDVSVLTSSSL